MIKRRQKGQTLRQKAERTVKNKSPKIDLFLGIDPGKDGYFVFYDGRDVFKTFPIPYLGSEPDIDRILEILDEMSTEGPISALLEHQQSFGTGGANATFTLGFGFGVLKTCLKAKKIRFDIIRPNVWKKELGIPAPKAKNLPQVPKKPKRGKGESKEDYQDAINQWKIEKKEINKKRGQLTRAKEKERKELANRKAVELGPGVDFRKSNRAKTLHSGKCEAFLLSVLAFRKFKGSN